MIIQTKFNFKNLMNQKNFKNPQNQNPNNAQLLSRPSGKSQATTDLECLRLPRTKKRNGEPTQTEIKRMKPLPDIRRKRMQSIIITLFGCWPVSTHEFQKQFQSTRISGAVSIDTHLRCRFNAHISGTVSTRISGAALTHTHTQTE